jgi:hypothetical protein
MSVRDQLLEEVSMKSEDWKLRNILADWYDDNNLPEESACVRWMLEHRKRPYHASSPYATWFNADTIKEDLGDHESDIPGKIYDKMVGGKVTANHRTFETRQAAEEAFIAAWLKQKKEEASLKQKEEENGNST